MSQSTLFKVSDYVAEFWNTVSNLSMIGGPKIIIIKIIIIIIKIIIIIIKIIVIIIRIITIIIKIITIIIIMALLTSSAQCLPVMVYGA